MDLEKTYAADLIKRRLRNIGVPGPEGSVGRSRCGCSRCLENRGCHKRIPRVAENYPEITVNVWHADDGCFTFLAPIAYFFTSCMNAGSPQY